MATDITAIDILLEPDARMLGPAEANNERLRADFPTGFALDEAHRPHITLQQCFVKTSDLADLYTATGTVIHAADVTAMTLTADRYGYTPGPGMGIAGIWVAPDPALLKLQADVITAAAPFMAPTGPITAFADDHGNPAFDQALIDYVTHFTTKGAGDGFDPHVSTGVAPTDYLDKMCAEPFTPFAFAPAGAAVYQLGPFGTAARLLHRWSTAA
jgi:hypothetical protein